MTAQFNAPCQEHSRTQERVTRMEVEVENMAEKLDVITKKLDDIASTVQRWTIALSIYSGLASVAVIVVLNWDKLKGLWS